MVDVPLDERLELSRVNFQSAMYELYCEIQAFQGFVPSTVLQKYNRLNCRLDELLTAFDDYVKDLKEG